MGKGQRAVRPADSAVRQLVERGTGNRTPGGLLQENLPRIGGPSVRRPVPDEDTVSDDSRSGTNQHRAHQRLLVFPGPWHLLGLLGQSAVEQFVLHGKPPMESDQEQTEPGVYIGQTQVDVRPN